MQHIVLLGPDMIYHFLFLNMRAHSVTEFSAAYKSLVVSKPHIARNAKIGMKCVFIVCLCYYSLFNEFIYSWMRKKLRKKIKLKQNWFKRVQVEIICRSKELILILNNKKWTFTAFENATKYFRFGFISFNIYKKTNVERWKFIRWIKYMPNAKFGIEMFNISSDVFEWIDETSDVRFAFFVDQCEWMTNDDDDFT